MRTAGGPAGFSGDCGAWGASGRSGLAKGIFHPYYTVQLAPAIAALAGAGSVGLWELGRRHRAAMAWALPAAVAGTAARSAVLLGRTPTYQPWLRTVVLAGDLLGAAGVWLAYHRPRWLWLMAGAGVAAVSLLAGPAAYAVTTINQGNAGVNASAGPAVTAAAGTVGAGPFGGLPAGTAPAGLGEVGARAAARGSATADTALIAYLEANRGSATYLVATFGSMSSASIIIATGQPVMTIGGFNGSDPAPTLAQFQRLVAEGEVRYVLVSGAGGGFGGGGPGGGSATSQAISQWVTSHGKKVPATGYGSTATSGTLYDISGAS